MFVIHIGPRKTATTYLQSNFYRNRKALKARGWHYPIIALRAQNAHHQVVSSRDEVLAGEGALFKRLKRASDKSLKANANLLISSEGFRKWNARDFVRLGKLIGQNDVMIAYTLRDPFALMTSIWGEAVKNGRTRSFSDYAARQLKDPARSEALNPLRELEPVLDHAKLRLSVLDYDAIRRAGDDIYTAFCLDILGVDAMRPALHKSNNFSWPVEITDYLRALAERIGFDPKAGHVMYSRLFTACHDQADIDRIVAAMQEAGPDYRRTVSLDRNAGWYARLEADLVARLGPRIHPLPKAGSLFSHQPLDVLTYDMERLATRPEIANLLDQSAMKMQAGRVPWTKTPVWRTWRYIQRTLGF